MSLRTIWREIRRTITPWKKIGEANSDGFSYFRDTMSGNVPKWILNATDRWEDNLGHRPYDMINFFKGKNFIYKVNCETIEQGVVKATFYRKKIIK